MKEEMTEKKVEKKHSKKKLSFFGKVKNTFLEFFSKVKNSFSKKLLYAAIIETVYLVTLFFIVRFFFFLIVPIVGVMKNANAMMAEIAKTGFANILSEEIQSILDAKNKLILYVILFFVTIIVLDFFEKGFLWQFLTKTKFSIKKYFKVFAGTISVILASGIIIFVFYNVLVEEVLYSIVSIFIYLMIALLNIVQATLMKHGGFSCKKIRSSYFNAGFLLFPLVVFLIGGIIMTFVVATRIDALILIANLSILAVIVGWYKSFVLQYI